MTTWTEPRDWVAGETVDEDLLNVHLRDNLKYLYENLPIRATLFHEQSVVLAGAAIAGAILASFMGTTGAAMLMVRRVMRANAWRKSQAHVIIFLILFFQVLVLVRDQASALRPELIQSVRSLGAGRRALFRFVYLPASLPAILTALRQSVGTAVAVLYVAELYATQKGLGYYIYLNGSTLMNYPAMYAGIVAMSLLGLGLYFTVDWLEKRLCPWLLAG